MQPTPTDPFASPRARVEGAIASLSDADWIRVKRIAQLRALGVEGVEWEDLVQEALARLIGGSRQCPHDVPFIACLLQTVRSLASEIRERAGLLPIVASATDSDDDHPSPYPGPEAQLAARSELANVLNQFGDDKDVLTVLSALAQGLNPGETMAANDMSEKRYLAAQKRIRRVVARGIKGGN